MDGCSLLPRFVLSLVIVAAATVATAQTPIDDALRRNRLQQVEIVEAVLFRNTGKTTSVIFLRRYPLVDDKVMFCGEGLFGSTKQRFILETGRGALVQAPTPTQWKSVGCADEIDGTTLIDLR